MKAGALALALALGALALPARADSCGDGRHNGPESDVDCGGDCAPCAVSLRCAAASDCASGRCAAGVCAERPAREGEAPPAGYRSELAEGDAPATARTAGLWFFGVGYGAGWISALVLPGRLTANYVPVAGPWITYRIYDHGDLGNAGLALMGSVQAAGVLMFLGGTLTAGTQLVRETPEAEDEAAEAPLLVTPVVSRRGGGVAVLGAF